MRKEIFINGVAEYQYLKEDNTHSLFYNCGSEWSDGTQNTLALQIVNTGDNYIINREYPKAKKNVFDYLESLQLTILLRLIHSEENYVFEMAEKSVF